MHRKQHGIESLKITGKLNLYSWILPIQEGYGMNNAMRYRAGIVDQSQITLMKRPMILRSILLKLNTKYSPGKFENNMIL